MIRTNLTEMLQRLLKLSADAKAWKLVASGAVILLSAAAILSSAQGQTQYPPAQSVHDAAGRRDCVGEKRCSC